MLFGAEIITQTTRQQTQLSRCSYVTV